jgi:low affinity Fe/Cu permease
MVQSRQNPVSRWLERFSKMVCRWTGSSGAFGLACVVVLVWLMTGPFFHYSDTWQLVINTGTTVVTFLMVFLIQRSQNKDSLAVQLKLNELVAAVQGASNRLIDVEDLTEEELRALHSHYAKLVSMARKDNTLTQSHSVEEAQVRHSRKLQLPESPLGREGPGPPRGPDVHKG